MPAVSADGRTYRFRVRRGFRFSPPSGEEVTAETFRHTIERALSPRLAPGGGPNPNGAMLADVEGATALRRRAGRPTSAASRPGATRSRSGSRARRATSPRGSARPPSARCRSARRPCRAAARPRPSPWRGPTTSPPRGRPDRRGEEPELHRQPAATGRAHRLHGAASRPPTPSHGCSAAAPTTSMATSLGFDPAGPLAPGGSTRSLRTDLASRAGRAGRPRYVASPAPGIDGIAFNTRRPLFRDARMRRAVGYALDRTALAAVYGEQPSDHLIPPAVSGLDGNVAYPNEPDLTTARRLAGPGGVRRASTACGDPIGARIARIVRANLAPIGHRRADRPVARVPERPRAPARRRGGHAARVALRPQSRPGPVRRAPARRPVHGARLLALRRACSGSIASARGLRGPARTAAYAGLETALVRDAAPVAVYASAVEPEFFSERVGCRITQGALQMVDLGALCLGVRVTRPPARLHVNLVSRSRGARPPGARPGAR